MATIPEAELIWIQKLGASSRLPSGYKEHIGPCSGAFPGGKQGAGTEVELPGYKVVLVWDARATTRELACYATRRAPCLFCLFVEWIVPQKKYYDNKESGVVAWLTEPFLWYPHPVAARIRIPDTPLSILLPESNSCCWLFLLVHKDLFF